MSVLFIHDKIVDPSILSTDSTLIKANGHVWHKSSMVEGVVPRSGIDTDAMWGFSHTKGWIFGYKLHYILYQVLLFPLLYIWQQILQLPTYLTIRYGILTASLTFKIIRRILLTSADPGYDDHELYDLSNSMEFRLVLSCTERCKNTPADRIKLVEFYESN
jgi:hypothetical protein